MRVLHATAIPITAIRFVLPVARALAAAGYEVELACGPGRGLKELEAAGFPVHRFPISRNVLAVRNAHALGAMRGLIRRRGFQVVHVHTPTAAGVVRAAARDLPARLAYTMHGSLWGAGVPRWRQLAFTALERALSRKSDLVFTVNPDDAADCVRRLGLSADRVRLLPAGGAGVGREFFLGPARREEVRSTTRERLGLPPGSPVLTYVGRTVAAKGMGVLARAFAIVAREMETASLLVVGGPLEGDREPYTRERFLADAGQGCQDRVYWLGFQADVVPFLAAGDVVVLPSRREGFGMGLAEGAALSLPGVATETRGARAVILPEVTGLLVPIDASEALARGLLRVLTGAGVRQRMGEAARRRAADRFARDRVVSAYLSAYAALREEMKDSDG